MRKIHRLSLLFIIITSTNFIFAQSKVFDNLKNVMLHMSGGAAIEGLPIDKITPANFSIRGIFRVITGTK